MVHPPRRPRALWSAVGVGVGVVLAGAPALAVGQTSALAAPGQLLVARGHGWTSHGLEGPVPKPGACHYRRSAPGWYRPDPRCTPGAIDPSVTQADLFRTICWVDGYTARVRPPYRLTEPFKYSAERAYRDPAPTWNSELDHLVPLELGGASDTQNLWPQPDQGKPARFDPQDPYGINAKDGVEDRLHDAVCAGQVSLHAAQAAIVANWTTAEGRLGVRP